jgi:hypothetical protein
VTALCNLLVNFIMIPSEKMQPNCRTNALANRKTVRFMCSMITILAWNAMGL